jgi:hypothetical protein
MRTYDAHARVGKMYLAQNDALARVLTGTGYWDGFRGIDRADVGIETAMVSMYGNSVPLRAGRDALRSGGRYFAEDN